MRSIARKTKRLVKTLLGQDFLAKPDYNCHHEKFGSEYGGWNVALEQIDQNSIIYSFGVGEDASLPTI